ncbi:MAG: transporter substrate-binding domain-containing protein [Lachnospiraceae bacterium]|nr:transporter substrate-binding domain-containing protein [Lachnospiraceae bacterium]
MKRFKVFLTLFLILLFAVTYEAANVSAKDDANIHSTVGRVVTVGYYNDELFQEGASEDAIKDGYGYEYLQEVARYTGWKYEYVYGSFDELYDKFVAGEIDLLAGLGYTEERTEYMFYPEHAMGNSIYYLFCSADDYTIASKADSLTGKTIGTLSGLMEDYIKDWIETNAVQNVKIKSYADTTDVYEALRDGEVDAFIAEGQAMTAKDYIQPVMMLGFIDYYLCVAKDEKDLIMDLNRALTEIVTTDPFFTEKLYEKYLSKNAVSISLNSRENDWIDEHNSITVGYLDDYAPFCDIDEDGNLMGILSDIMDKMLTNIGKKDELEVKYMNYDSFSDMLDALQNEEIDVIFPFTSDEWFQEKYGVFGTQEFVTTGVSLVYKGTISDNPSGVLAVNEKNIMQYEYAVRNFEDSEIIYCQSALECMQCVQSGKADYTIINSTRIMQVLDEVNTKSLKTLALANHSAICFATRNDDVQLLSILNKGIRSLDEAYAMTATYNYVSEMDKYTFMDFMDDNIGFIVLAVVCISAATVATVAILVFRSKRTKLMYDMAHSDVLTGLFNRNAYEEDLGKINAVGYSGDLSYIVVDINGLKRANDTLGHDAGDELIKGTASIMQQCMCAYGKVYRIGGDEFVGILNASHDRLDVIRDDLEIAAAEWRGKIINNLSISVGCVEKSEFPDADALTLVKIADSRMYEAKSQYYKESGHDRRR